MNTCGTCRHIGAPRRYSRYDHNCDELPETEYRVCGLLQHLNKSGDISQQVAGVIDGSGYFAALCVTEEFGCNQWLSANPLANEKP